MDAWYSYTGHDAIFVMGQFLSLSFFPFWFFPVKNGRLVLVCEDSVALFASLLVLG